MPAVTADLTLRVRLGLPGPRQAGHARLDLRQAEVSIGVNYMTIARLEKGHEVGFSAAFTIARKLGILLDGGTP